MKKNFNNPLVSIIMNCHNGEKYLKKSIKSVISQNYKNWELIFWNNQSKDNSKKIFKLFNDKRLKYFESKKFQKLYEARNSAIKNAKGEYICFLDTDDWWVNHMYYSMSKFNMSLMAKFWNKEFPDVSVNTLWPRTTLDTAPVRNILGGDEMVNISRTPDIMGDAAMHMFKTDPMKCNGKNYIDDEVLASLDIDVEQYRINKELKGKDLMPDFFC